MEEVGRGERGTDCKGSPRVPAAGSSSSAAVGFILQETSTGNFGENLKRLKVRTDFV